ncbi:MAG: Gfo/Idh/MocA family oxidoreductase [Clostridiales bacterium]|jgi:glycerol-3-phosphate cytidylyltransferase|nr:Gfo/Idh/MocA family oxidoreductase [Clostridiales bacterium]
MKKVITYGSFDLFHEGHRSILRRAREMGDSLIVGVTTEQYDVYRGKINLVDSLMRRIDNVRKTGLADEIIVEDHEGQKAEDIQKYAIDLFVIGSDWRGQFDYLDQYCEVKYLDRTQNISSTDIRRGRQGFVLLGIAGTGRAAGRLAREIRFVSGVEARAAYNPSLESARTFAGLYGIESACDNYEAFLEKTDAVYIATPHATHYDYARHAILAGRHVLCEKPMTLSAQETRELFELANDCGVVLMEAVKTAYAPAFLNLLAVARCGRIGTVYDVECAFTKLIPEDKNAREYEPKTGGSFTELASYSLLPIIKILGRDYRVEFRYFRGLNGCDIYAKALFAYDNATASAKTGIGVKSEGQLLISGTRGYILARSPWWLTKTFEVCYENPEDNETFSGPFPGCGLRFEIADFTRNITDPNARNYKFSREDSVAASGIIEQFLRERNGLWLKEP